MGPKLVEVGTGLPVLKSNVTPAVEELSGNEEMLDPIKLFNVFITARLAATFTGRK
jgi:hypothetical protein